MGHLRQRRAPIEELGVLEIAGVHGAALLLLADLAARLLLAPAELPLGILTALLGAPFFLYLLRRGAA